MQKLITGFAAIAALSFMVSASQAGCAWHQSQVTASTEMDKESVSMSTYDGAVSPVEEAESAATECPADATECAPAEE